MAKKAPLVVVDDDQDDKENLEAAIKDLQIPNKIRWFRSCPEAFDYLKNTTDQPFVIICDLNLPKQTGLELKRQIDEDKELRRKSIPFIFYSTSADQRSVNDAYTKMTVQGFFQKASNLKQIEEHLKIIYDYWQACIHPNTF